MARTVHKTLMNVNPTRVKMVQPALTLTVASIARVSMDTMANSVRIRLITVREMSPVRTVGDVSRRLVVSSVTVKAQVCEGSSVTS